MKRRSERAVKPLAFILAAALLSDAVTNRSEAVQVQTVKAATLKMHNSAFSWSAATEIGAFIAGIAICFAKKFAYGAGIGLGIPIAVESYEAHLKSKAEACLI